MKRRRVSRLPHQNCKKHTCRFFAAIIAGCRIFPAMTIETYKGEIAEAVKAYEHYIVCIDKTPEDFEVSLTSLMGKAIKAYENRGEGLRHGIALDKQVTIILSQSDDARPLCGIYFNLHSPYRKTALPKSVKTFSDKPQD
jgi:hypothetical protein